MNETTEIPSGATHAFSQLAFDKFHWNAAHSKRALFTRDYERFLDHLCHFARIVPLRELPGRDPQAIQVGLRFDVDSDLHTALFTAEIEHHLGIPATYFILPTAEYYGAWSKDGVDRNPGALLAMCHLQNILGREIGYHDDWVRLFVEHAIAPERSIAQELECWRGLGVEVSGICSHNSAYVYGVGAFEVWEGQSIDARGEAVLADRKIRLGHLSLSQFGLGYDANFLTEATWRGEPLQMHGREWSKAELISRDVDYQFFLGYDGLCTVQTGRRAQTVAEFVPLADMPELIHSKGKGMRWLFLGHPEYFGRIPTLENVPAAYDDWVRGSIPPEGRKGRIQRKLEQEMESSGTAIKVAKLLFGRQFVARPASLRARIRYFARRNNEGVYWENARPGVHFMAPYMERAFDFILSRASALSRASLLDLAGGCGNLGLALLIRGLGNYVLNDTHGTRLVWAAKMFAEYGFALESNGDDLRRAHFGRSFDFITLLGWENFDVPYDEAIAASRRWQNPGGWLILTYQDNEEYRAGRWDELYRQWHGNAPEFRDGLYTVSRRVLTRILEDKGYELQALQYSGHAVSERGYYPQYLAFARLGT